MTVASLGLRTSNITINQAPCQLLTTAAVKCKILEVSIVSSAATAASYGFGRPAAAAVTPGTTSTFQRDDSADPACVTTISLTYATSPTNPTNMHRRWNSAATIGVGTVWSFPQMMTVPVSGAVTICNITASAALDVTWIIDE